MAVSCAFVAATGIGACQDYGDAARPIPPTAPALSPAPDTAALEPATCSPCHADHVTAWSGSMHAYASDDPIFVAMNARGQRETNGALGTFCFSCHAPLAIAKSATGSAATTTLIDPATLPTRLRGVTCFFCHTVDATLDLHDGALRLAGGGTFRGAIRDPLASSAHASTYSPLHDRTQAASATMCGACHDLRTQGGADLERTYAEWQTGVFSGTGDEARTCGGCHMPGTQGLAATVPGATTRTVHDHAMAALDTALVTYPEMDAQRKAVQLSLDSALTAKLCVRGPGDVQITLENARIGHAWPTGATHDRRAWVELVAYANGARVWSSGAAPNDAPPDLVRDPTAVSLGGSLFGASGAPVKFLWEAASTVTRVLPVKTSDGPGGTSPLVATFAPPSNADRVTMRVRVVPFAPDVLDALVASGDLDPEIRARAAANVRSLASTSLEWTIDRGYACLP